MIDFRAAFSRTNVLIALALTASSLVVAGCSRKADPTGTAFAAIPPGSVTRGGTLRINFRADNTSLVSLDPFQVYWIEHRVLIRNLAIRDVSRESRARPIVRAEEGTTKANRGAIVL